MTISKGKVPFNKNENDNSKIKSQPGIVFDLTKIPTQNSKSHEIKKAETRSKLKRISENSSGLENEKSEGNRPNSKRSISEISRKRVSSNFVVEK